MKTCICTSFKGHYLIGSAAVVIDENPADAADHLMRVLEIGHGLKVNITAPEMIELPTDHRLVRVLCDGNY